MAPDDDQFMRDTDALAWNMEQDPGLRSTIVAVAWLSAPPDGAVLAARLERATRLAPKFRQRPVRTPAGLANPQWVDCDFDLSLHLRRFTAPEPRTDRTVLEFARLEAMTGFDTSRPLWSFTLLDGLEGDRAALVMKVHHSLTDGVGGMQLAMLLFDTTADPAPVDDVPVPATSPAPSGIGLARGALGHLVGRTLGAARTGLTHALPMARESVHHPVRTTLDVVATVSSLGRFVRPMSDTLSPIMTGRSLDRHLDLLQVDLADLKRAGASVGGTVNDAFVAAVTGGLRRYHEQHGAPVGELRVTMPISLRREGDPEGGNRITLERFAVPVGESDPGARVRTTGWRCRAARYEEALPLSDAVAGLLNLLPSGVIGSMLKHVDVLASDVPGAPVPIYLAGAPVTGYFAFGPTTGAALNVTLLSYQGTCCVGCTIDTAAVPDADKLMGCLRDGFDEVLGLAGEHRRAWSPLDGDRSPHGARGPAPSPCVLC
jgi:WS/DGAT/MGAT family acyltransferase